MTQCLKFVPNSEYYNWFKVIDNWNLDNFTQAEKNLLSIYLENNKAKLDKMLKLDSMWMKANCDMTDPSGAVPEDFPFYFRKFIIKIREDWKKEIYSNIYKRII